MRKLTNTASSTKNVRENSIGWMLKMLCTSLDADMNNELKCLDLNPAQFAVLMTLSEIEGLSQTEIGKKITMPGYATTRTIDVLEEKKFVVRKKDDHSRRSHRIYLTDKGRKIIPDLFVIVKNVNKQLLSVLSATEKKHLSAILKKLVLAKIEGVH